MRAREVAGEGERREEGARESGRRALPRTAVRRDLQRHARLFAARRGGRRCVPRQVLVGVEELRHVGELLVDAVVLLGRERHVRVDGREQPADHRRRRGERARRREERRLFFVQLALAPRDRLLDQLNEGLAVLPLGVRRRRYALLGVHVDRAHLRQVENGAEAQAALAVRLRAAHGVEELGERAEREEREEPPAAAASQAQTCLFDTAGSRALELL